MPFPMMLPVIAADPDYLHRLKRKRGAIDDLCSLGAIIICRGVLPLAHLDASNWTWEIIYQHLQDIFLSDVAAQIEGLERKPPAPTPEMLIAATAQRDQLQAALDRIKSILEKNQGSPIAQELAPLIDLMMWPLQEQLKQAEAQISAIQAALENKPNYEL